MNFTITKSYLSTFRLDLILDMLVTISVMFVFCSNSVILLIVPVIR